MSGTIQQNIPLSIVGKKYGITGVLILSLFLIAIFTNQLSDKNPSVIPHPSWCRHSTFYLTQKEKFANVSFKELNTDNELNSNKDLITIVELTPLKKLESQPNIQNATQSITNQLHRFVTPTTTTTTTPITSSTTRFSMLPKVHRQQQPHPCHQKKRYCCPCYLFR